MSKKDTILEDTPVQENKMVTVYVKKGGAIINGKLIKQGKSVEVTKEYAESLKKTVIAKVVDFK